MAITVIVHVMNQEPFLAEVDELPSPSASFITITNPRLRNGKPVTYIEAEATKVLFPWHRISFLETMPGDEDQEAVESFFRD